MSLIAVCGLDLRQRCPRKTRLVFICSLRMAQYEKYFKIPRCVDAVEKFLTPPYFFPRPFPLTPPPSPLLPSPSYPHSPTHSLPVGVIVEYVGSEAAAKDIAMHIAANKPIGMNSKDVPESVIAAERYALKYARTCKYTHVLTLSLVFITGIPHPLNGIFANLCLVRSSTISLPSS